MAVFKYPLTLDIWHDIYSPLTAGNKIHQARMRSRSTFSTTDDATNHHHNRSQDQSKEVAIRAYCINEAKLIVTFVTQQVILSHVDLKFIMFIQFSNMTLPYQNSANASPMCLPVYNYFSNLFWIRQEDYCILKVNILLYMWRYGWRKGGRTSTEQALPRWPPDTLPPPPNNKFLSPSARTIPSQAMTI